MRLAASAALFCALASSRAIPAEPPASPRADPPRFTLQLKDGTHLIGSPRQAEPLVLQAAFGRVEIPLDLLAAVVFEDPAAARIAFRNGDTLTGRLELELLSFDTPYGRLEVPADQLLVLSLAAIPDSKIAAGPVPPAPQPEIRLLGAAVLAPEPGPLAPPADEEVEVPVPLPQVLQAPRPAPPRVIFDAPVRERLRR